MARAATRPLLEAWYCPVKGDRRMTPPTPPAHSSVADWLGVEVLAHPDGDSTPCTIRIRQLGKTGPWYGRAGTAQELQLYRAVIGLVQSAPVQGRDLVLDVALLAAVLKFAPTTADEVYQAIRQRAQLTGQFMRQRDEARSVVGASNSALVDAVANFRRSRAATVHPSGSVPFHRREGELTALDFVLRLLQGEEPLTPPSGDRE